MPLHFRHSGMRVIALYAGVLIVPAIFIAVAVSIFPESA